MIRVQLAIFAFATGIGGTAVASDLADRAADVFRSACLSKQILSLGSGSSTAEAIRAGGVAISEIDKAKARGSMRGLVGKPVYKISPDGKQGTLTCHVSSKHMSVEEATKHFDRLKRIAFSGQRPSSEGRTEWDDGPSSVPIDGRSAFLEKPGRKLALELFWQKQKRGPSAHLYIRIEHLIGL